MEASYYIDTSKSRNFAGLRLPKIPFSASGAPILPAKGDFVGIHSTLLVVKRAVWQAAHEFDNNRVTIHLEPVEGEEDAPNST